MIELKRTTSAGFCLHLYACTMIELKIAVVSTMAVVLVMLNRTMIELKLKYFSDGCNLCPDRLFAQ